MHCATTCHHHHHQQQRHLSGNNRNRAQKLTLILIVIGFLLATSKLSSICGGCGNWRTHCRPEDWVGEALAILCYHPSNLSVCPGGEYENLISWPGALPQSKAAKVHGLQQQCMLQLGFSTVQKKNTVNYLVGYYIAFIMLWLSNSHHSHRLTLAHLWFQRSCSLDSLDPHMPFLKIFRAKRSFHPTYIRQPLKTADRES